MRTTTTLGTLLLLAACGGSSNTDDDASGANASDPSGASPTTPSASGAVNVEGNVEGNVEASAYAELDACRNRLTDAEMAASLMLAYDADASVHELIACGGLSVQIAIGLVTGVVGMIVDDDDIMPSGLEFQGGGVYQSESTLGASTMNMKVRLYERVGDEYVLVEEDLFDRNNYLTGIRVEAEAGGSVDFDIDIPLDTSVSADASLVIAYDEAGAWAKLLGLGDPPPNPIEVTDVADIDPDFGSIYMETEVEIHDVKGDSNIALTVTTPRVRVLDLFDGGTLDYEVVGFEASNAVLRQELTTSGWQVSFVEHATLAGAIDVTVESRARKTVSYDARLAYDNSSFAVIDFACAE